MQEAWIILSPLLYFNFKSFKYRISSSFSRFHYILHDSGVLFLRVFKSLQIKEGTCNFWREPIWQKVWIIWFILLYLNFQSFRDPNFSSFIRFQYIMHDLGVLFLEFCKFLQIKQGWPNFLGELILQKAWVIWPCILCFNFKSFMNPNFLSFIRFQRIMHYSTLPFWEFWNFNKLKRGDLICGGNQFCRKSELFGGPFFTSILKAF